MNTKQNLEQPLHLTGRENYSFANVCSIFKRGRKPFNLRPGVYKIGEESEVKRYFEKYYVSQQWFILVHDKSKMRKYFKKIGAIMSGLSTLPVILFITKRKSGSLKV